MVFFVEAVGGQESETKKGNAIGARQKGTFSLVLVAAEGMGGGSRG